MEEVDSFHWNLARIFFGVTTLFALLGIFCNSIIFLTTVKTRSLRATYNILIAVCAIADVFHQFGIIVQFPILFGSHLTIDSDLCNMIMFLPEMGIGIGCACILCIGFDRMLSVLFSLRYRALNKTYYHFFLGSLITLYCTYFCVIMIIFYRKSRDICDIISPYHSGGSYFAISTVLVNFGSSFVYFLTWMGLRSHADSISMKRIIKSLFIIITVDVSGWILTPGIVEISQHLNIEKGHKFALLYFGVIFMHVALAIKLPIYYLTSTEYRAAIRSLIVRKSSMVIGSVAFDKSRPSKTC